MLDNSDNSSLPTGDVIAGLMEENPEQFSSEVMYYLVSNQIAVTVLKQGDD